MIKELSNNNIYDNIQSKISLLIYYYFQLLYFLILLPIIQLSKEENSRILLTINGTGTQEILYNYYANDPYEVYVNNIFHVSTNKKKVNNLIEPLNNITIIWNSQITDCNKMFVGLTKIIYIDLSSFDTSSVTDMNDMFLGCSSLTSINLNKLKTSKVTNMADMFNGCNSLISLNLNDFDTSSVTGMGHMFAECSSLQSLTINKIVTSKVEYMDNMFYGCSSLISLNLRNFDTSSVIDMNNMFYGCSSLVSLNLKKFIILSGTNTNNIFDNCNSDLTICINIEYSNNVISSKDFKIDCNEVCDPIDFYNKQCKMGDIQKYIRNELQNNNLDDLIYTAKHI